jgi:small subunit ribosomal protein S6e
MKLNIAFPATGCQKVIEIEDDAKLRAFYEKRISHEVDGGVLGEDFKGYVFKITGGSDKQGFPMRQGVLTSGRVKLLFQEHSGAFHPKHKGERKKRTTRGCIISPEVSAVNLIIIKKGDKEIAGLTDVFKPRRLGPRRANHIRKMFNLEKADDVRKYVVKSEKKTHKGTKTVQKGPKIQRLITPLRLQHKREYVRSLRQRYEKSRLEAKEYGALLVQRQKEQKDARYELIKKRRETRRSTTQDQGKTATSAGAPAPTPAKV